MYCFSNICRICLNAPDTRLIKLNNLDFDKIRIREKLKCCIPEVINANNLPELICISCCKNLRRSYTFKQMCLQNTEKLSKYASKLVVSKKHKQGKLSIGLVDLNKKNQVAVRASDDMPIAKNLGLTPESVSIYTISLNQWDLFETKFTCRCIKEYSSFTEETRHLCKSCEGDLVGFQLSKVKVGISENRYNSSQSSSECVLSAQQSEISYEYSSESLPSLESPRAESRKKLLLNSPNSLQNDTNTAMVNDASSMHDEVSYNYSDVLMCKMRVTNTQKEVNMMRSVSYTQYNDSITDRTSEPSDTENNSSDTNINSNQRHKCPLCVKTFSRQYDLFRHYKTHKKPLLHCVQCAKQYMRQEDLDKHTRKTHTLKRKSIMRKQITRIFVHKKEQKDFEPDVTDIETDLNCTICNERFENKTCLTVHLMTHKKDFKCRKCDEQFIGKEKLTEHLLTHTVPRIYQCNYCSKSFNYSSNLKRHMRSHAVSNNRDIEQIRKEKHKHNGTKLSKTHQSSKEKTSKHREITLYNSKNTLNETHKKKTKTIDSPKKSKSLEIELFNALKSPKRDMSRKSNDTFIGTVFTHTPSTVNGDYTCLETNCDQSFTVLKQYYRHLHDHNGFRSEKDKKPYKCIECDKTYMKISTLYKHMVIHPSGKKKINRFLPEVSRFTCKDCGKQYNYIKHFIRHIAKHNSNSDYNDSQVQDDMLGDCEPNDVSDVKNESIDENFNDEIIPQHFLAQTNDAKAFACVHCEKSYTTKQSLKRHMLAHTGQTEKYSCSICFKQFVHLEVLERHILTHSKRQDERGQWVCEVCDKAFMQKANLKRHMLVHERPLLCNHCRDRFDHKDDLLKHIIKFARGKYCKLCKLEFSKRTDMEKHMLEEHTNCKDYCCNVCDVNFENADFFRKHTLIHPQEAERKFECGLCDKAYVTKHGLIRHNFSHTT